MYERGGDYVIKSDQAQEHLQVSGAGKMHSIATQSLGDLPLDRHSCQLLGPTALVSPLPLRAQLQVQPTTGRSGPHGRARRALARLQETPGDPEASVADMVALPSVSHALTDCARQAL